MHQQPDEARPRATLPKPSGLKHRGGLKPCKLIRSSFHFLLRWHSSSGRVSLQQKFSLQSSWLSSLPGRRNGLANLCGSYTVEIGDSTPLRFSGCSPLPNTVVRNPFSQLETSSSKQISKLSTTVYGAFSAGK